jgi:hypothetical protein
LEVEPTGSVKLNFPDRPVGTIPHTCSLDVADGGGSTLDEVGMYLNVTRERTRQIETRALANFHALLQEAFDEDIDDFDPGDR